MTTHSDLRELGLFDARVPRYTSYPPANHFTEANGPETTAKWLSAVPIKGRVSLYVHIPYCRRLCWFCACRTQGTSTNRPLVPYLAQIAKEFEIVDKNLPKDVKVSHIHLGGGTPTILDPSLIERLGELINNFRPKSDDLEFSVEIDPTEVDQERIDALRKIGMTRASIGVQDFDPLVQDSIGRQQSYEDTKNVVHMLREAGVNSLNMDILYGLPHQTNARLTDSVQKVLSLAPDRVALYGYAHVPWMAKRQVMIPSEALPHAEDRLKLFEIARKLFVWDGYEEIGIDHYARPDDSLAVAARDGTMRRNFQGYTEDSADVLIGFGASAISRYPQGYAQNHSTSSKYAAAIEDGHLATARGHTMSADDQLRGTMIDELMCNFELDAASLAHRFGTTQLAIFDMTTSLRLRFADHIEVTGSKIRLIKDARLIARLAAQEIDAYQMPDGRHSRAM